MLIDFHCHIYPKFNLGTLLSSAFANFEKNHNFSKSVQTTQQLALSLTERSDCNAFEGLKSKALELPPQYEIQATAEDASLWIKDNTSKKQLLVLAGQQLNTSEKLELLAFACPSKIPSKLNWQESFAAIRAAGGIPVINWAPGKWWFQRGKLIRSIINQEKNFLLCDTALRPCGYTTPSLMKYASSRGIKTFHGSDPLPLTNEEKRVGSYGSLMEGNLDHDYPAKCLKDILLNPETRIKAFGKRLSAMQLITKQFQYYASGKGK